MVLKCLGNTVARLNEHDAGHRNPDDRASLHELAELFGYSQNYLRNLISRGDLKAHKRGKL